MLRFLMEMWFQARGSMKHELFHVLRAMGDDRFHPPVWKPSLDVYRTSTGWLLKFELAGVRMEDVRLEVLERIVRLSGVRRDLICGETCTHHTMEIAYSRFERSVELPCDLGEARVSTQVSDGMLLVRIEAKE